MSRMWTSPNNTQGHRSRSPRRTSNSIQNPFLQPLQLQQPLPKQESYFELTDEDFSFRGLPSELPSFTDDDIIGSGDFGKVYKVKIHDIFYALKRIVPEGSRKCEYIYGEIHTMIYMGLNTIMKQSFPMLHKWWKFIEDGACVFYLLIDYIKGESMESVINSILEIEVVKPKNRIVSIEIIHEKIDKIPKFGNELEIYRERYIILLRVFNIIKELDRLNLLHNDLHLGNIILERERKMETIKDNKIEWDEYNPVVIDFGLSCVKDECPIQNYRDYHAFVPGANMIYFLEILFRNKYFETVLGMQLIKFINTYRVNVKSYDKNNGVLIPTAYASSFLEDENDPKLDYLEYIGTDITEEVYSLVEQRIIEIDNICQDCICADS